MQAPLQAKSDSDAAQTDIARTVAQNRVLADNRPEAVAQRKLAAMMNNSPRVLQRRALSDAIHSSPRMVAQRHKMNTLFDGAVKPQGYGAISAEASPAQRQEKTNNTGLPNQLKSGIESLSGMSMDHVKVQQAQGRVRPTVQIKGGVGVNDDVGLEQEADLMGWRALGVGSLQMRKKGEVGMLELASSSPPKFNDGTVIQRGIKFADKEAGDRCNQAIRTVSTLAEVIKNLNALGVDITIKVDDDKLGDGTFGAFYHGENMIRITSLHKSNEIFRGHNRDQIDAALASNLSHELKHALDYFLTQKKNAAELRGRLGKNPDGSEITAEEMAEDNKYENVVNPQYSSQGGGVMRTEWRAWAIEAATTYEQMSGGEGPPQQFIGLKESFEMGLAKAAIQKESIFYKKSLIYYNSHRATMMSEEGLASANLDKFFTLKAVQPWLQEAEGIFRMSIHPFIPKVAKDEEQKESHMAASVAAASSSVEAVRDPIQIDSGADIATIGKGINKPGAKVRKVRKEDKYNIYEYNEEVFKISNDLTGHLDGAEMSGSWAKSN